ncbi:hypothetical protein [Tenacibaculum maritimum]|uniref:hypothetical protein n=1 Tax=Tenacibaculum maritimum TaxID=107401 RepID=UPI001E631162|nr:hypothetical protein [Tenacibaculum maritimum]MCD9585868.1 hypothetical protein [Tenacibaculum maritimum]MCD9612169.1 hypothetical protein [Tenacibaculum maritimum]MCD9622219.1 hypothetical protein [Tenacibaculum maritimum]MCD9628621.1 hypothetical protein [Tenacibaculum maritimum]MCD9631505.1 hypothetical protein [Tenacibaculum maritimum]
MKIIEHETVMDVSNYGEYLESIKEQMPINAYNFASEKGHYDFYGRNCTHDLQLDKIEVFYSLENRLQYLLHLKGNEFKHDKDLKIEYVEVQSFKINCKNNNLNEDVLYKDDIKIDEVSLDKSSNLICHEIQFHNYEILILCKDLIHKWI